MSLNRNNPVRDKNEREIVKAIRQAGFIVTHLSGAGVPDLLYMKPSVNNPVDIAHTIEEALAIVAKNRFGLIEIKQPGQKLTDSQRRWWNRNCNMRVKMS